ncbi:MAG: hypothetical protein ACKOI2_12310 [Actinomycetota bacterium]
MGDHVEFGNWEDGFERLFMGPGQRVPTRNDFGFCSYDDAPAPLGGGQPWFYWFPSKSEMLSTLAESAGYLHKPRGDFDIEAITTIAKEEIAASDGDLKTVKLGLNAKLSGVAQFTWMGPFADLCDSDRPQERAFRADFRENGDDGPIGPEELDSFTEYFVNYGI